jgi:hypothetical protein
MLSGLMLLGIGSTAQAQLAERRVTLEARGGLNVPTFDISDAVDAGPSFGVGAAVQFAPKLWLMGDVDLGFHPGASLPGGTEGPDVNVYHYVAKVGYELVSAGQSPWSARMMPRLAAWRAPTSYSASVSVRSCCTRSGPISRPASASLMLTS